MSYAQSHVFSEHNLLGLMTGTGPSSSEHDNIHTSSHAGNFEVCARMPCSSSISGCLSLAMSLHLSLYALEEMMYGEILPKVV